MAFCRVFAKHKMATGEIQGNKAPRAGRSTSPSIFLSKGPFRRSPPVPFQYGSSLLPPPGRRRTRPKPPTPPPPALSSETRSGGDEERAARSLTGVNPRAEKKRASVLQVILLALGSASLPEPLIPAAFIPTDSLSLYLAEWREGERVACP